MSLDDRLIVFFKKKGITNKALAKTTGYSETMVGRYLRKPNYAFLTKIIENYPDIDLNYILKNQAPNLNLVLEPESKYKFDNAQLIKIIEEATCQLKNNLASN